MDEAEKEYKKINEQISESQEAMKVICRQFYCGTMCIYDCYTIVTILMYLFRHHIWSS